MRKGAPGILETTRTESSQRIPREVTDKQIEGVNSNFKRRFDSLDAFRSFRDVAFLGISLGLFPAVEVKALMLDGLKDVAEWLCHVTANECACYPPYVVRFDNQRH
jgi:hypothetical protein